MPILENCSIEFHMERLGEGPSLVGWLSSRRKRGCEIFPAGAALPALCSTGPATGSRMGSRARAKGPLPGPLAGPNEVTCSVIQVKRVQRTGRFTSDSGFGGPHHGVLHWTW